ncbi:hypothetical protein, partial [Seonamhaeicola sp.]
MKTYKTEVIKELWELLCQKILLNYIFFGIIFIDALGAVLPTYLDRKVTMFASFPLIFVIYMLNTNKRSLLFILAIIFNFLGICNFNNPYQEYNSKGLLYHVIAFLLYSVLLFKRFKKVDTKLAFKLAVVLIVLVGVPFTVYFKGMNQMLVLQETTLYVLSATVFVFSALLLGLSNKTKLNKFLIVSAILVFIS